MVKVTKKEVEQAEHKAHAIDEATQATLGRVHKNNRRAVLWFVICWSILLIIGVLGLGYQNYIARENKEHIDCIVRLLATPIPDGEERKVIEYLNGECNIRFYH